MNKTEALLPKIVGESRAQSDAGASLDAPVTTEPHNRSEAPPGASTEHARSITARSRRRRRESTSADCAGGLGADAVRSENPLPTLTAFHSCQLPHGFHRGRVFRAALKPHRRNPSVDGGNVGSPPREDSTRSDRGVTGYESGEL